MYGRVKYDSSEHRGREREKKNRTRGPEARNPEGVEIESTGGESPRATAAAVDQSRERRQIAREREREGEF